jgi:hypothetical protein
MTLVQARDIDCCAIEPVEADQIDRALEGMWQSGDRQLPGRLCVLHRREGAHVATVRMFTNRVCRRLQAIHPETRWDRPKIEGSRLASVARLGADAPDLPIIVVRASRHSTPKSILTGTLESLGHLYLGSFSERVTTLDLCETVLKALRLQGTKMIIFENLPDDFGGKFVASVLGTLRRHGLQILCILP